SLAQGRRASDVSSAEPEPRQPALLDSASEEDAGKAPNEEDQKEPPECVEGPANVAPIPPSQPKRHGSQDQRQRNHEAGLTPGPDRHECHVLSFRVSGIVSDVATRLPPPSG